MPSERGPVCVSVINMKGGVGKTTTVALLGRHAAYADLRVLVVDLDPQANLSQAYMGNAYVQFLESEEPSIVEVFDGYRPPTQERESPNTSRLWGFPYSQNPSTHSEPRTRLTTLRLSALLSTMDSMTEETTGDPKNAVPCQKYLKRRTRTAGMYLRNRSPTHAAFPSSCAGIGVGVVTPGASICLPRSSSSVSVSKKTTDATT